MTIDGVSYHWGRCENCDLHGLLRKKYMVQLTDLADTVYDRDDPMAEFKVCITCFETPSGCKSENLAKKKS
jgi:hypothetical protein